MTTAERLGKAGFELRRYNEETDLSAVQKIFAEGMRLYSEPLPSTSALKPFWERYIENSLKDDLSDIQSVYFEKGGYFWVIADITQGNGLVVGHVGVENIGEGRCELRRMRCAVFHFLDNVLVVECICMKCVKGGA